MAFGITDRNLGVCQSVATTEVLGLTSSSKFVHTGRRTLKKGHRKDTELHAEARYQSNVQFSCLDRGALLKSGLGLNLARDSSGIWHFFQCRVRHTRT